MKKLALLLLVLSLSSVSCAWPWEKGVEEVAVTCDPGPMPEVVVAEGLEYKVVGCQWSVVPICGSEICKKGVEYVPPVVPPTDPTQEVPPTGKGSLTFEGREVSVGNGPCNFYAQTGIGNSGTFIAEVPDGWSLTVDAWIIDSYGDGPWLKAWSGPAEVEVAITDGAVCLSNQPAFALAHRQQVCPACKEVKN